MTQRSFVPSGRAVGAGGIWQDQCSHLQRLINHQKCRLLNEDSTAGESLPPGLPFLGWDMCGANLSVVFSSNANAAWWQAVLLAAMTKESG